MDPQTEPSIDALRDLRRALPDVFPPLLKTQRAEVEKITGPMSPHEALSAAISDPRFAWLRAMSELITQIDALITDDEPDLELPAELLARTPRGPPHARLPPRLPGRPRARAAPPDPESDFGRHYLRALQLNPDVVL